ncbi:MAG: hypothetical protein ACYC27_07440 [Armatimonadota bacterium]
MKLENLQMAPFNTTLMGVLKGIASYYGINASDQMLFGKSGHAFLMNIHKELCPSGPYCWNWIPFIKLVQNMGIGMIDQGFFHGGSSESERRSIEQQIIGSLESEIPCSLMNMENQLITGYDDTGLLTAQPWPGMDFPQSHLTFGTWEEFGNDIHANFFTFTQVEPADKIAAIRSCLEYAIDLYENPRNHTSEDYGIGPDAYLNWITAVDNGHGSSHGNWWNAMVWSECREMASRFFTEIAADYPDLAHIASDLPPDYAAIANALNKAGDKEMDAGQKIGLLKQAASLEAGCVPKIKELIQKMG